MFHENGYGGTESHFGTGERGEGKQWQDIAYTADANYDGNSTVISIENADYGGVFGKWNTNDGNAVPAFTDAQVKRLIDLGTALALPGTAGYGSMHRLCPKSWSCYENGIPAVLIPDTKPGRRGFGYHAQGVAGQGLVSGGVKWSKAYGKVCPGARRIKQIKEIIIPGIAARLAGGEDDMDLNDKVKNVWEPAAKEGGPVTFEDVTVNEVLRRASRNFYLGVEARGMLRQLVRAQAESAANQAAILGALQGVDTEGIKAAVAAAVDKKMADFELVLRSVGGEDADE
jgi:hypothetical protein